MRGRFRVAKLPAGDCGVKDQVSRLGIPNEKYLQKLQIFFLVAIDYLYICAYNKTYKQGGVAMKKFLVWTGIVAMLAVGLVGCGGEKPAATQKVLRVGTSADFSPFEFMDEKGKMTGFDVELMPQPSTIGRFGRSRPAAPSGMRGAHPRPARARLTAPRRSSSPAQLQRRPRFRPPAPKRRGW